MAPLLADWCRFCSRKRAVADATIGASSVASSSSISVVPTSLSPNFSLLSSLSLFTPNVPLVFLSRIPGTGKVSVLRTFRVAVFETSSISDHRYCIRPLFAHLRTLQASSFCCLEVKAVHRPWTDQLLPHHQYAFHHGLYQIPKSARKTSYDSEDNAVY